MKQKDHLCVVLGAGSDVMTSPPTEGTKRNSPRTVLFLASDPLDSGTPWKPLNKRRGKNLRANVFHVDKNNSLGVDYLKSSHPSFGDAKRGNSDARKESSRTSVHSRTPNVLELLARALPALEVEISQSTTGNPRLHLELHPKDVDALKPPPVFSVVYN